MNNTLKPHYFTEPVPDSIRAEIKFQLKEQLPQYTFIDARYKSAYKDDDFLYLTIAISPSNEYAFWTYNKHTKSFNHGHYCFTDLFFTLKTMNLYFHQ